jgi:hypothetical protein
MKNPINFTKNDLPEIMNIPLQIWIGPAISNQITETLEGMIVKCSLAGNEPYLPGFAEFLLPNWRIRKFNFFEIKQIKKI